jgi:hypothetical protein
MEPLPHSHAYKKDIYAQLQYEIREKLKTCVLSPSEDVNRTLVENMVQKWLDENTELGTRTKKEYIAHNVPKILHILPLYKEIQA